MPVSSKSFVSGSLPPAFRRGVTRNYSGIFVYWSVYTSFQKRREGGGYFNLNLCNDAQWEGGDERRDREPAAEGAEDAPGVPPVARGAVAREGDLHVRRAGGLRSPGCDGGQGRDFSRLGITAR